MQSSVFQPSHQENDLDSKIIVALEKISEAFRVLLWTESTSHGLSPIQIQLLIFLLSHQKQYCKVTYLAQEFNMTKPTISDAVKVILQKGLATKIPDEKDSRSYRIELTDTGRKTAEKLSLFANAIKNPVTPISQQDKEVFWKSLISIITGLRAMGVISLQRMCFNCANYLNRNGVHHCQLLNQDLETKELRIDCNEFRIAV